MTTNEKTRLSLDADRSMIWIGDIPTHGARLFPDRTAIFFADRDETVNYAELDRRSNAFAEAVQAQNLKPGDRVAYLGKNSDLFFPVLFGAIRSGVVMVPINWRLAVPEIAYQIKDSGAQWVICDPELEVAALSAIEMTGRSTPLLLTEACDGNDALRARLARPAKVYTVPHDPDQICLQLYTSGTTGKPKGALISHGAFSRMRHIEVLSPHLAHLGTCCVVVSAMPNFHSGGLSWATMALVRQGTIILTADASPSNILRLIREQDVEHAFIVPTVIRSIVEELRASSLPVPVIKGLHYGAMPIGESLLNDVMDLFGCKLVQYFGMTEVIGTATILGPDEHDPAYPQRLTSVGRPYPGISIEIRARDGHQLSCGEHGEIWIKTPSIMSGYWNLPEATAEALVDGWYATGDGGYLDEDGYLYLTDRLKDVIVSGGENIYPVEVEEAMRKHPAVLDAGVFGMPHERWGEMVVAMAELRPGASVSADQLQAHLRSLIAGYKIPKTIHFGVLPRTASGKVQRGVLRRPPTSTSSHIHAF